ncbi:MAG: hypothetical protein K2J63_09430 [Muribaculaceae bacterium]|nr:hypothetical protein [Muribaculaceae bacterium]
MKRLVYIITVLIALWQTLPAMAVTDKEMEQARVIATQTYLRYANDGSDYLDALHPSTMAQLEKSLKAKEKENIKAFKAVPVPTDYASWDKQKLVDYWSNTAFSHSGLSQKGKVGKSRARKKLAAMTVAAPAPAATETKSETKPAEQKPAAQAATTPAAETKPAPAATKPAVKPADAKSSTSPVPVHEASLDSAQAELDEARALAEAALAAEDDAVIKKESTNTWIYVVVLCILVAVVVALVVFASNVMKKSAPALATQWNNGANSDEAKALARKLQESNRRLEEAERQNVQLRKKVDALTAEIAKLRTRATNNPIQQPPIQGIPYPKQNPAPTAAPAAVATQQAQASQPAPAPTSHPAAPAPAVAPTQPPTSAPQSALRTIYLGRANSKGIFVRADRTFNPGNSVFRLDTSDGLAGTFKVVSDPSIIEKVTEHPAEMLSVSCVGPDLGNTSGLQAIVTDSAGTAIFEGGCWKVMRKAKIHYE